MYPSPRFRTLLCAALLALWGACAHAALHVAVAGPTAKVRPGDALPASSLAGSAGARNEFVALQIVVSGGSGTLASVSATLAQEFAAAPATLDTVFRSGFDAAATPLGRIPADRVMLYRAGYYDVQHLSDDEGALGRWPDPLIPARDAYYGEARNAFPFAVPANENRVIYVEVLVPEDAAPGLYQGRVDVTADGVTTAVPLTLTVRNFALPATSSLRSLFQIGWQTTCVAAYGSCGSAHHDDAWNLNTLYARAALDHRTTIANAQYQPPINATERAAFETYLRPLIDGTSSTRLRGARLTSVAVDTGSMTQLAAWRDLARLRGFENRAVFYNSSHCDEPSDSNGRWSACPDWTAQMRATWPGVPNVVTTTITELEDHGAVAMADILTPVIDQLHGRPGTTYAGDQRPKYDTFLAQPGNSLWIYNSCDSHGCGGGPGHPELNGWAGYMIDEPASHAVAMSWLAWIYRASGELYYAADLMLPSAWDDQWAFTGNGDGTLFYPGNPVRIGGTHPIPVESLRLKYIRDGRQDYEYLRLAAAAGHGAEARQIATALFASTYQTTVTDAQLRAAREQLAALIR